MLTRALDTGVPALWPPRTSSTAATAGLRRDLQTNGVSYVLAVAKSHRARYPSVSCVPTRPLPGCTDGAGTGPPPARAPTKGDRDYDWALLRITPPAGEAAGHHWLLARRRISDGELVFAPEALGSEALIGPVVRAIGMIGAGVDRIHLDVNNPLRRPPILAGGPALIDRLRSVSRRGASESPRSMYLLMSNGNADR